MNWTILQLAQSEYSQDDYWILYHFMLSSTQTAWLVIRYYDLTFMLGENEHHETQAWLC